MPRNPEASVIVRNSGLHRYLVFTGHAKDYYTFGNEVVAVNLNDNYQCILLGHIRTEYERWTNCCIQGENLYVSNLGPGRTEMWRFNLKTRSASVLTRLRTPRWCHAMTAHHSGHLYIIGGYNHFAHSTIANVDCVDPIAGTGPEVQVGNLKYYNITYNNLRTCEVEDGDLLVVGAWDSHGHTTLQLWSPSTASTTAEVSLGQNIKQVYGLVYSGGFIIVLADYATVVCRMDDLLQNRPHNVRVSHKYQTPNKGCAVVLTPQNHILLLGGMKINGFNIVKSVHSIYKAPAQDVITNTGHGWQPLDTQFAMKDWYINGYDITNLPLQG